MSLNLDQIKKRIAPHFFDIEQVSDTTLRFEKRSGEETYAIYYLDIAKNLPDTEEQIKKYQDLVIGPHYFKGRKSLQWNNYLYFVINGDCLKEEKVLQAKELIESDRIYARKLVIPEDKLNSVLIPSKSRSNETILHDSILSIWTNRLVETGIDKVIRSKENMPTRMKLIEDSFFKDNYKDKEPKSKSKIEKPSFIKLMEILVYSNYPKQKHFEFGKVNLIVGPNGSGKTSLLESIELFYCGRTKRNPNETKKYEFTIEFEDGRKEHVTNNRNASEFRTRNLLWYGQSEIKTNNIYQSFARYNFLDTDAAMSLADSTTQLEDDLSKLLVGPEAAEIWHNMNRVDEAISVQLRSIQSEEQQIEAEIDALTGQIKKASNIPHESDSIYAHLNEMVKRVNWFIANDDKEAVSFRFTKNLPEMIVLLQQILELKWLDSSVSLNELTRYCYESEIVIEQVELDLQKLKDLKKHVSFHDKVVRNGEGALILLDQVKIFVQANIPKLLEMQRKQQEIILECTNLLAGLDEINIDATKQINLNMPLVECCKVAISKRAEIQQNLIKQQKKYNEFCEVQDKSFKLAQELRQIANEILGTSLEADQCPLCHTQFNTGELIKHMTLGVDQHLEVRSKSSFSQLQETKKIYESAVAVESALSWLMKYCENTKKSKNSTASAILSEVERTRIKYKITQSSQEGIKKELLLFESQGLSSRELNKILDCLRETEWPLQIFTETEVELLQAQINDDIAISSKEIESNRRKIEELQKKIAAILDQIEFEMKDSNEELSQLKGRLYRTQLFEKKLSEFNALFPWAKDRPLAKLLIEVTSIHQLASELQRSLSNEKQADVILTDSLSRKAKLEPHLFDLCQKKDNFNKVQSVLQDLKSKHSLEVAMESALRDNRKSIEQIFSRIHSPAEFKEIGSNWKSLIRLDGEKASLSQISTGQRAAFALSIFLSQNAQLKNAPPVILIDDPIAYIDDLNSLAFIDYLRELVLTNERQVYFATANYKLATLFERKFDFLGKDFCRFDLKR